MTSDKSVHQLFEEQVERNPNQIALICGHSEITYAQLNQKANQLAYYLRRVYLIKKGDCVALCMSRSIEMIIVILAILKTNDKGLFKKQDNYFLIRFYYFNCFCSGYCFKQKGGL